MKRTLGFTILELMVVVSLIGILVSMVILSLNAGSAQSRDGERKADLRNMQAAIELYKQKNGRYPAGCNDTTTSWEGVWSGQAGSGYECPGGSREYIIGLAPDFIPVLPTDPKLNSAETFSGYVYTSNPDGSVYKFMALNTVEDDFIPNPATTAENPLARCGNMTLLASECLYVPTEASGGGTNYVINTPGDTPSQCRNASEYRNDYAVWGGFAPGGGSPYRSLPKAKEYYSEEIRCK